MVVVAFAVLLGVVTQTSVGLGLGLVSAPVMTIATPSLMPGALIMLAATLPFLTLIREHRDIDWFGLGWSMPWRVVGTAAGVWVITQITHNSNSLPIAQKLSTQSLTVKLLLTNYHRFSCQIPIMRKINLFT